MAQRVRNWRKLTVGAPAYQASPRDRTGRAGQAPRRLRAERGLSREALAHECGINRTYLSGVERSERNVSIDNIARIARGLEVEAWRLLRDV
jgi:transcriptional regulator with XRE-family HTH domain